MYSWNYLTYLYLKTYIYGSSVYVSEVSETVIGYCVVVFTNQRHIYLFLFSSDRLSKHYNSTNKTCITRIPNNSYVAA